MQTGVRLMGKYGSDTLGLDTYAKRQVAQADGSRLEEPLPDLLFDWITPALCGGIMSGSTGISTGCTASFRGKIYAGFIEAVTGQSLYQEVIPTEMVKQMHLDLSQWCATQSYANRHALLEAHNISMEQAQALENWFNVVQTESGIVCGWW